MLIPRKAAGTTLEKHTAYTYDLLDRLTEVKVDPDVLALTTTYNYDALGNRTSIIDPSGHVIYTDYDNANRKVKEYFAAASGTQKASATVKKEISYYDSGLVKDVNSYDYNDSTLLARAEFKYDPRRRLKKVTQYIDDVNTAVTVYDYNDTGFAVDSNCYQIKITDANNKISYIALDHAGRRTKTLYPSNDYEELEYNGDGTLKRRKVWDGATPYWVDYYYDGYGRITDVNYPDDGYIQCSYIGFGRKSSVTDNRNAADNIGGAKIIAYDYDPLGRIIEVTDQNNWTIYYSYRADGQKETIDVNNPSSIPKYQVQYSFDAAGRLKDVNEPLLGGNDYVAGFEYDENGNRSKLKYYLQGTTGGNKVEIDYTYNKDSLLIGFDTTAVGVTGPTFTFNDVNVDGLGRLTDANETITNTGGSGIDHFHIYGYDKLSQLIDANISNIGGGTWTGSYTYKKNGDMIARTINDVTENFGFTGHLMTAADSNSLDWDNNGNLLDLLCSDSNFITWNWDNKLRSATKGSKSIDVKYDPAGNRIWKNSSEDGIRRYIVDVVGKLPVILMELNSSNAIQKTYIHANGQILAQHDGDTTASRYFYLHDRLGSVRQIIDIAGDVNNRYTYDPFGKPFATETEETVTNPFKFTGQFFDSEIDEYYLRARMYDPILSRFTSRDPVYGQLKEPLSLHEYLYCSNNPVNKIDPRGELAFVFGGSFSGNITASDLSSGFNNRRGLGGIGAMVGYYSGISPAMTMLSDHFGAGGTAGIGAVVAWDHTKSFNDRSAWSWGTMQWVGAGASWASGRGRCVTGDIGISNATHVSQLSGRFVEGGISGTPPWLHSFVIGGTVSRGVNPDGSWNDIWLGTASFGVGTPGYEGHLFVGNAWVQDYEFKIKEVLK